VDGLEPVVQAQAAGAQRWPAVVGQRPAHRQAIAADGGRFRVVARFECPLQGAHAARMLLELLLGVAIRLEDRLGRLAQVMELAQLMRHAGEDRLDGGLDR
jgi:hypothetical protein